MSRMFSILSAFAVGMILLAGIGVYWITDSELAKSKQAKADALVSGVGLSVAAKIDTLSKIVDKMAQDPEVAAAISSNNPDLISAVTQKLERYYPDVQKIRLLLPEATELDQAGLSKMSLADLDMVREAVTDNPPAAIHGTTPADRHLAIARKITQGPQAVGVILASVDYDFIGKTLKRVQNSGGNLELKQDKLVLAGAGPKKNWDKGINAKYKIAETGWELHYDAPDNGFAEIPVIAGFIVIPGIIFLILSFFAYRKLSGMLMHDLSSVMTAFMDMVKNKPLGSYPVQLKEFNVVVSTLARYKRLHNNEDKVQINPAVEDPMMKDLFWEDFGISLDKPAAPMEDFPTAETHDNLQSLFTPPAISRKTDETAAIFRAYDIRGIVGSSLTREGVYDIGRALGTDAKTQGCKTIVMGRDGRTSSRELSESLARGIASTGCNVLDVGMVPTPVLYFVAHHLEDRSGVMVTGSHNPAQYNGLKMVIKGETLAGDRIQQLKLCIDNQAYAVGQPGTIERNDKFINEYIGTISEDVHLARPMTVVLDCGNGVAGELGPVLLRTLGCEVIELFCEVDGSFPNHHPDPSKPENLNELILAVQHYHADLGLAFDGDGDRLGVVDSNGKIIWPDRQMMLFAKDVLARKPGAEIIYDVKCSRHLGSEITKHGGRPVMWKTGHSFMKAKLKATGAKLAGEMSGHIFFNDRWFGFDDALYAAARLIEILSADTRTSAEVFGQLPDSINTPELNVNMAEGENFKFIDDLMSTANFAGGKITTIDGMRVDFPNGWGLVRASNTTPSLVIRFEADTKEALKSIQDQIRQQMVAIKPDIILPF
ncbi:MAG: phosphomannomutase/phosphoglucomutase [Methylosarcina sp.]